jgi:ribosomal-protein-alanine N-acetyltransferase
MVEIMNAIPTLSTQRLILRPFSLTDAPRVQLLAGAWEVANTLATMPHPYPDGAAQEWIAGHAKDFETGKNLPLAICLKDGTLIGDISLMGFRTPHSRAEIGYWLGKDYWGQGYCTEALRAVIKLGFEQLGLNRIFGQHWSRNVASGKVMHKAGLKHEGLLRQHVRRWKDYEDVDIWGLLRSEWAAMQS